MTDRPAWVDALLSHELTPSEYRVWAYLNWRQGTNGHAWPAQATIAADLGLTVQGVRNITRRLAVKGWLRLRTAGTAGRSHKLHYEIRTPAEKVNGGLPFAEHETVNSGLPFAPERVNGHSDKGSTAVDPNTYRRNTITGKKTTDARGRIRFDRDVGEFIGIDGRLVAWQRAYPDLDVPREICQAAAWASANPGRAKKNWGRFIVNWLSTANKDFTNGRASRQHPAHRPSFAGQVSTVGEVVKV